MDGGGRHKYTWTRWWVAYFADTLQQGFNLWFPFSAGFPTPWVFFSLVSSFPDSQWSESYHNGREGQRPGVSFPFILMFQPHGHTMEFHGNFPQSRRLLVLRTHTNDKWHQVIFGLLLVWRAVGVFTLKVILDLGRIRIYHMHVPLHTNLKLLRG